MQLQGVWLFAANDLVFLVPVILVVGWLLGRRRDAFYAFVVVVLSLAVSYGMGLLYRHPAPYQVHPALTTASGPPENAFPSQHTAAAASFALGVLRRRYLVTGLCLAGVAVLVGVARVVVGYHWPIDVLAGAVAGVIGLGLTAVGSSSVTRVAEFLVTVDDRFREVVGLPTPWNEVASTNRRSDGAAVRDLSERSGEPVPVASDGAPSERDP